MKTLASALLVSSVVLAGCATQTHTYRPLVQAVSFPPLDEVHEAVVGDDMVRQGKFVLRDTIYLPAPLQVSWYRLAAGYYRKTGEGDKGEFFIAGGGQEAGQITAIGIADQPQSLLVRREDSALCVVTVYSLTSCFRTGVNASAEGYERRRVPEYTQDSFQQALIYNGRVGRKINVGYREFSNNMARPAFSNNVEYDLEESKDIAYRGARIQVLEATNRSIKYRVLQNFNTPAQ